MEIFESEDSSLALHKSTVSVLRYDGPRHTALHNVCVHYKVEGDHLNSPALQAIYENDGVNGVDECTFNEMNYFNFCIYIYFYCF